jgi:hypothetical protein
MTPTPKLRFIERVKITHIDNSGNATGTAVRILQQWHVPIGGDKTSDHYKGEWRDVPLEKEE